METVASSMSKQRHVRQVDDFFAARSPPPQGFTAPRTNESGLKSCMEDPGINYQSSRNLYNNL